MRDYRPYATMSVREITAPDRGLTTQNDAEKMQRLGQLQLDLDAATSWVEVRDVLNALIGEL